jgi:hypothetical protein
MMNNKRKAAPERMLPVSCYADIAPLPVPLAEYQLQRLKRQHEHTNKDTLLQHLLAEVRDARETAFEVMDDFVRNRNLHVSPELRLSTEWLVRNLAAYDPANTMPAATYKNWQRRGIIRMDAHGKPRPSSAAATLIVRMMDPQKENIFPESLVPSEPDYWCIVITAPSSAPQLLPVDLIHLLPPAAVVLTPWAGASWSDTPARWHLIGENEKHVGAIRFAGTKYVRGQLWWDLTLQDLMAWDKQVTSLYVESPGGNMERQVEDLANVVLNRLWENIYPCVPKDMNRYAHVQTVEI